MVFAPLPPFEVDGLGVYSDAPAVEDRVNRGDLTGQRVDRITVVCESPGVYTLPGLQFQWWDPVREQLNKRSLAPVNLEVVRNPAWSTPDVNGSSNESLQIDWRLLWVVPVILLLWWPGLPLARRARAWLRHELGARRLQPLNPRAPENPT